MITVVIRKMMNIKHIGGVALFRPRMESEILARREAERHLREGYASGTYDDPKKVNEILQHQFAHFYNLLHSEVPKTASRHLMEFVLAQYDAAAKIEHLQRNDQLSAGDLEYWNENGPLIRRSFKHLAELVVSLAPAEAPAIDETGLLLNTDTIVICCELLVKLYNLSDQTHGVHPESTTLSILPEGRLDYLDLQVRNFDRYSDYPSRIAKDTSRQQVYLSGKPLRYDLDFQAAELDTAFQVEFGFGYKDAIQVLRQLIDNAVVADKGAFDVPFVGLEHMIEQVVSTRKWPRLSVKRLIDGFTLTKTKAEERQLHKPKQEHRAFRRGFFEMPHEAGVHLVWSRCMARECLFELMKGTLFQRGPAEWKSVGINKALATLQNKGGDWFEVAVGRNMAGLGALGKASVKSGIGAGADRVLIPSAIGEIDYLGFFPAEGLIVLLEDKMVDGGFEATYFREHVSSFVSGKNSHSDQLRRKVEWVRDNLEAVCKGLSTTLPGSPSIKASRVAGALVTLDPSYASYFVADYPCVSLTELMDQYKDKGAWPFASGVHQVI